MSNLGPKVMMDIAKVVAINAATIVGAGAAQAEANRYKEKNTKGGSNKPARRDIWLPRALP